MRNLGLNIAEFTKPTFQKKKFLKLLFTASCSIMISTLLFISDNIIAGHMISEKAISAIEIMGPIYEMIVFLGTVISDGTSTLYTEAVGSMDRRKMSKLFSEGIVFTMAISLLVAAFAKPVGNLYINSYDVSLEIRELAGEYLRFNVIAYALTPIFLYLSAMVYAEGDDSLCNVSYIVNFTANIGISILACHYMGIKGIGFGTMCGTLLSIAVLCLHFFKKTNTLHFLWHASLKDLPEIMKFSVVDASSRLYKSISVIILNWLIISIAGDFYLPVFSAVISLVELEEILDGIGEALTPIVNVYQGENNLEGVKKINNYAAVWAGIEGVLFVTFVQIFAPLLPSVFGIETPEIYQACVVAFRIVSFTAIGTSLIYFLSSYYVLTDHIFLGSAMCGLNTLIFPVCIGSVLSVLSGIYGIWFGYIISSVLTLIVTAIYIACHYGKSAVPFMYPSGTNEIYTFEISINEDEILATRDSISDILKNHEVSSKTINYIMLACEDIMLLIKERNKGKKILAECTLAFDDSIEFTIKDDGEIFDITNENLEVTSLRSMVVSSFMEHWHDKVNMVTISYNRNKLTFRSALKKE